MDKLKDFWVQFSFWKWMLSLVFFTAVNITVMQTHVLDASHHLDIEEKTILLQLKKIGSGAFNQTEKIDIITRLVVAEKEVQSIKSTLELYRAEGRLQTPEEKTGALAKIFRDILREDEFKQRTK